MQLTDHSVQPYGEYANNQSGLIENYLNFTLGYMDTFWVNIIPRSILIQNFTNVNQSPKPKLVLPFFPSLHHVFYIATRLQVQVATGLVLGCKSSLPLGCKSMHGPCMWIVEIGLEELSNTVQWNTIQYSTAQYSTVQHNFTLLKGYMLVT